VGREEYSMRKFRPGELVIFCKKPKKGSISYDYFEQHEKYMGTIFVLVTKHCPEDKSEKWGKYWKVRLPKEKELLKAPQHSGGVIHEHWLEHFEDERE
jgi:hypothetical protein